MPQEVYPAHDQPDVATVTDGEHTVMCTVFVDVPRNTLESVAFVVLDNGTQQLLWRKTIRSTPEGSIGPDCPRIMAVGTRFVVHWLEGTTDEPPTPALHRSWIDINNYASVTTWTYEGSVTATRFMYDAQPIGSATDYVVVTVRAGDIPRVQRFNGMRWIDTTWGQNLTLAVMPQILAIWGRDGESVLVAYARLNRVWCTRINANDGLAQASMQVFASLPTLHAFQAGFAQYSTTAVALVLEYTELAGVAGSPLGSGIMIPSVAYGLVTMATAVMGTQHAWHHLRLLTRPLAFAGARQTASEPNIYAVVAYQNAARDELLQRNAWVVNLDARRWTSSLPHTVRPRPVSNLNLGDMDTRVSGYSPDGNVLGAFSVGRRINHISSWAAGAERGLTLKSRSAALVAWGKVMTVSDLLRPQRTFPVAATIKLAEYHIEEPWTLTRDGSEPAAGSEPYHGLSPYVVGQTVAAGAGGVVGGGTPAIYDGQRLVEAGFSWAPEIYEITNSGIGSVLAGTYQYCATFERRDARGQLHRSAPSIPVSHTVPGGPSQRIELEISTMTLSMRDNTDHYPDAAPIEISLWRTTAGGTVFRRVYGRTGSANAPRETPTNDPSTWRVTVSDSVPDSGLEQHEILPFSLINGAWTPLPPMQPPAFSTITSWQDRTWGVSSQDGVIWYSQENLPEPGGTQYLAPEWNPNLVFRVDGYGRCIALQPMDEALVAFFEDSIVAITGFGAAPDGTGATLQSRLIATGVGCIEPRSVVLTPEGIFFQAFKGLYLLGRGYALDYISKGARVEDSVLAGGNVRAATHFEDRHEVRFVTNDAVSGAPSVLIYDYLHDLWSTATLPLGDQPGGSDAMSSAVGGAAWLGTSHEALHAVVQQGALLLERPADDATPYGDEDRNSVDAIPLGLRTGWVHPSGIAGYQRCREIQLSLDKPNASGVAVDVETDMDGSLSGSLTETHTFPSPAPTFMRCRLRHQKGAAFRVRIREIGVVPVDENLAVTGMTMLVGRKRGLRRR